MLIIFQILLLLMLLFIPLYLIGDPEKESDRYKR